MSDRKKEGSSNAITQFDGIKFLAAFNDNPSLQISSVKLGGTNYLAWSRLCLLSIQARGLQGYIKK